MGKDKKEKTGGLGSFKTKDTLRDEDVDLTKQLVDLERKYAEIYQAVGRLSNAYRSHKDDFAIIRYGNLKDMIKACTCDEIMQKAGPQPASRSTRGKSTALLQAAQKLSSSTDGPACDEVQQLHKAEIVKDIEEKKKRKEKIETKFLRLHNRLGKLKRDYEESKRHIPTKRYLVLKEIIKPLIRDDALKPE